MDLAEITNFIALDNPARAFECEEDLLEHAHRIGRAPLAYAVRADLGAGLRSCVHGAKFSRTGGNVKIDASARDGRCRISVIDHGHGIPAAFRKELFERFSQADSSDGRSRGGTGLGMAIAKHLTEQMSGRISFESEENVGTVFHLEFPLASSEADAA
jgi:light-regulated signal transduction histidine kinase (bacteriophytochrome)